MLEALDVEGPEEADDAFAVNQDKIEMERAADREEDDTAIPTESRISRQLSEEITKVVVSLVLIMLFLTPLFQLDTYIDTYLTH